MADIIFIFSQYELLTRTAEYLSTLDLFHTALTCHELYTSILKSPQVFNKLKRVAICDGHGLKKRQGPDHWSLGKGFQNYINPWTGGPAEEEEIEVRLFNIQCDAFNALPCIKCGVNVCEECRYVPRIRNEDNEGYDARELPYCDASDQSHYLECYCPPCDEKMEQDLPLRLSHFCDCNQYTRWICYPCRQKEAEESADYYADHTTLYYGEDVEDHNDGIYIMEHQFDLAVFDEIVKVARDDGILPDSEESGRGELNEDGSKLEEFDIFDFCWALDENRLPEEDFIILKAGFAKLLQGNGIL